MRLCVGGWLKGQKTKVINKRPRGREIHLLWVCGIRAQHLLLLFSFSLLRMWVCSPYADVDDSLIIRDTHGQTHTARNENSCVQFFYPTRLNSPLKTCCSRCGLFRYEIWNLGRPPLVLPTCFVLFVHARSSQPVLIGCAEFWTSRATGVNEMDERSL